MTNRQELTPSTIAAGIASARKSPTKSGFVKLGDTVGLYLKVTCKTGAAVWCFDYTRPTGRRTSIGFGAYTERRSDTESAEGSIAWARDEAEQCRTWVREGKDPMDERTKAAKQREKDAIEAAIDRERARNGEAPAWSFRAVADEWRERQIKKGAWGPDHVRNWNNQMNVHLFPAFGLEQCKDIDGSMVFAVFDRLVDEGKAPTARFCLSFCEQVFAWALVHKAKSGCLHNPVLEIKKAATVEVSHKPHAAAIEPHAIQKIMRLVRAYVGGRRGAFTSCALQMCAWTFQRPLTVASMEWAELDLDAGTWSIPSMKMKRKQAEKRKGLAHVVPLPRQAVQLLTEVKALTGGGRYVFPGRANKRSDREHMARATLGAALQLMGIGSDEHSAHGFRAMARTCLLEIKGQAFESALEAHLAHISVAKLKDKMDAAGDRRVPTTQAKSYVHYTWQDERRVIVQEWADVLDQLANGADVLPGESLKRLLVEQPQPAAPAAVMPVGQLLAA